MHLWRTLPKPGVDATSPARMNAVLLFWAASMVAASTRDHEMDVRNRVRWRRCGREYKCQFGIDDDDNGDDDGDQFCRLVDRDQLCDGKVNCRHGDDEHNCRPQCPWFKPHPVPNSFCCLKMATHRCDFKVDCADGSDEWNCRECRFDDLGYGYRIPVFDHVAKYQCDNGHCVYDFGPEDGDYHQFATLRCDGKTDCEDGSDERRCGSFGVARCLRGVPEDDIDTKLERLWGQRRFLCERENKCVPESFVCNGAPDCASGMDERDCRRRCPRDRPILLANSSCCVSDAMICDGVRNCYPDDAETRFLAASEAGRDPGADEDGCESRPCPSWRPFKCRRKWESAEREGASWKCLENSSRCDGIEDCLGGSDERNCDSCGGGGFLCRDKRCIDPARRCDGVVDCVDDESCDSCPSDRPWKCRWKHGLVKNGRRFTPTKCVALTSRCNGMRPGFFPEDGVDCRWTKPRDLSDHENYSNDDYSDEIGCDAAVCSGVLCPCGVCIHESFRCNGVDDCVRICAKFEKDKEAFSNDGTLEMGYLTFQKSHAHLKKASSSWDEINCTECQQSLPYPDPKSRVDFPFSDHEVFGAFHIETLQRCIPIVQRCDGCIDLDGGEDEEGCQYSFPLANLGFENCPMGSQIALDSSAGTKSPNSPMLLIRLAIWFSFVLLLV